MAMTREQAIRELVRIARGEVGQHEHPRGSNRQKYGKRYGFNGVAWCVIFCWWLAQMVKLASRWFPKTASVAALYWWAKHAGRWSGVPRPGAIGLYPYGVSHAVFVIRVLRIAGRLWVEVVAGNSNAAGSRDADEVVCKRYPASVFRGFFLPRWGQAAGSVSRPAHPKPAKPRKPGIARVLKLVGASARTWRHGGDVVRVQRRVGVKPDGWFGPRTDHAVKAFQSRWNHVHKLRRLTVDGDVGPRTCRALGLVWRG